MNFILGSLHKMISIFALIFIQVFLYTHLSQDRLEEEEAKKKVICTNDKEKTKKKKSAQYFWVLLGIIVNAKTPDI